MVFRKLEKRKKSVHDPGRAGSVCGEKAVITYRFEGEDVPGISMYTFQDRVPVWIFGGRLQIDFGEISKRLHFC